MEKRFAGGALVTGAARGIGRGVVLGLAERGLDVAVHYRHSRQAAEEVGAAARRCGVQALVLGADLTDAEQARAMVGEAAAALGGLAVLVNNVGDYLGRKSVLELSVDDWRQTIDSNLHATFAVTQSALPYLRQAPWGRIVNLGYAGAQNLLARTQITAYAIAKTGVVLYSKALAKALAGSGITVNVVAPGVVETSIDKPLAEIPMRRPATIDEVVRAVLFFADQASGYVTGQVLEVAGGWNL